jgi:DNA modification methylase
MLGDNIKSLQKLPDNSIDSIVTDPPYGLSFMGKKWDYDVPSVEFWKEVWRVLKPGGHILSFGGTRTYHRMVVNIEDAGFEIRDQIMWLYGSGFPKSHNIGKAVDKRGGESIGWFGEWLVKWRKENNIPQSQIAELFPSKTGGLTGCVSNWELGNNLPTNEQFNKICETFNLPFKSLEEVEREFIGTKTSGIGKAFTKDGWGSGKDEVEITKGQSPYEGWGTAMKPAQEIITVAKKPEDLEGTALNLIYNIKKEIWKLYVYVVEQSSELNQVEQKEVLNTAQCLVEKNTNIQDALQGLMDMSQLRLMENMNWNIVLLWHTILEDLLQKMSRYTTSTKSNLIIDLKTLKSLEWQNILENITQAKNNQTDGLNVNALTAVVLFNALNLKLKDIQQHSVEDNVIYKEDKMDCLNEPICVARKPLSEKSVAENVLRWGTGGINVDGCRVGTTDNLNGGGYNNKGTSKKDLDEATSYATKVIETEFIQPEGRFPANIILECLCDEVIEGEKGEVIKRNKNINYSMFGKRIMGDAYSDKGDIHTNPMCPCYLMDEQSGVSDYSKKKDGKPGGKTFGGSDMKATEGYWPKDKGGASRFFYQAKVSKQERNMGLDHFEEVDITDGSTRTNEETARTFGANRKNKTNSHPTVKPVSLMAYLCRLVTPPNGIVLDPFMGSGSTGIAAQLEGFRFCGMEMDADYFKIAEARIENYEQYKKFIK